MADTTLPSQFSEYEPWAAEWCLPTESERYAKRVATAPQELQAFYDAFYPRPRRPWTTWTSTPWTTCPTTR